MSIALPPEYDAAIKAGLLLTPEQAAERDRILMSRYFLVRQGSLGEISKCRNCGQKHPYLTLHCVEQPFSGIDGGLYAFYKVMGRPDAVRQMTPEERRKFRDVKRLFRPMADLPDLGAGHPGYARQVARYDHLGDRDAQIGAVALGILEPIPRTLAQRYLDRINLRGGKLTVPGLNSEA
jgi:hypothetical protein